MGRPRGAMLALLAGCLLGVACSDSTAPAPAAKLAFIIQPGTTTAGVPIAPKVAVAIEDAGGNIVSSESRAVTLTIEPGASGGDPVGPVTVSAVDGIATFSNLRVLRTGAGYTLRVLATGLTGAESDPFDITAGPAVALLFTTQPSNALAGAAITPPVAVSAQDSVGNRVTTLAETVTVALAGTWPAGTLSGTTAVMAVNGVATFSDLSIALGRTGAYQLVASSRNSSIIASAPFSIGQLPPPTATLRISTQTTGSSIDPDGFSLCLDIGCSDSSTVGVNDVRMMTVDTGAHTVLLAGVAGNCTVAGANPHAVHAATGETVSVQFDVSCAALTLRVTTATTGDSFDPSGSYQLCVDPDYYYGCSTYGIGVNAGVSIPISAGSHSLELDQSPCQLPGQRGQSAHRRRKRGYAGDLRGCLCRPGECATHRGNERDRPRSQRVFGLPDKPVRIRASVTGSSLPMVR